MDAEETHPDHDVPESIYDEDGEPHDPDAPVGQAEPDAVEPEAPVDLPTTSTDPPAAS